MAKFFDRQNLSRQFQDIFHRLNQAKSRLAEGLPHTPLSDIGRNVQAFLGALPLGLASREEMELQQQLLTRAEARIRELEARIEALERQSS